METSNDRKRARYHRLILEQEQRVDHLTNEQRKIQESLLHLQEDLQRGYRTLTLINEEGRDSHPESSRMLRKNEEQEQIFRRELNYSSEQLFESYSAQRKELEEEKEEFYRKRGEIPWD